MTLPWTHCHAYKHQTDWLSMPYRFALEFIQLQLCKVQTLETNHLSHDLFNILVGDIGRTGASQVNLFPLNTLRHVLSYTFQTFNRIWDTDIVPSWILFMCIKLYYYIHDAFFFPLTQSWKKRKKIVEAFKEIVWKVTKTIHAKNHEWKSQFGFFYCVQLYLRLKSWINFNLVASNFAWHLDKNVIFNVLRTIINFLKNIHQESFYFLAQDSVVESFGKTVYRLNIGAKKICKSVGFW